MNLWGVGRGGERCQSLLHRPGLFKVHSHACAKKAWDETPSQTKHQLREGDPPRKDGHRTRYRVWEGHELLIGDKQGDGTPHSRPAAPAILVHLTIDPQPRPQSSVMPLPTCIITPWCPPLLQPSPHISAPHSQRSQAKTSGHAEL